MAKDLNIALSGSSFFVFVLGADLSLSSYYVGYLADVCM